MISEKYRSLLKEIADAAIQSGRDPGEIQLVVVSKTVESGDIQEVYDVGCRDFGENRVQEALSKQAELPEDIRWHLIGSLQLNKVRKIIGQFDLIHSVDSLKLAEKISEVSEEMGLISRILLQVNTSREESKHGFSEDEVMRVSPAIMELKGVEVEGLMTMAPFVEDRSVIRSCFVKLREIRDELRLRHLSMGMTHDWREAVEEGATILRVGSAIFRS